MYNYRLSCTALCSHVAMVTRVGQVVVIAAQAGATKTTREAVAKKRPKPPLLMRTLQETHALDQELLPNTLIRLCSLYLYPQCHYRDIVHHRCIVCSDLLCLYVCLCFLHSLSTFSYEDRDVTLLT